MQSPSLIRSWEFYHVPDNTLELAAKGLFMAVFIQEERSPFLLGFCVSSCWIKEKRGRGEGWVGKR